MARILVTSGSDFKPFTYDELVKPLAQMAEAHATTQTALDTLAMEAGNIGAQIGSGEDTERSRAMYDAYMKQLQDTADRLYKTGYNTTTARGLSKARALYGSDIGKINQAITQRNARADEYRKALASDKTLITEFNPLDKGLDNWLDNPQYGYYQSYSGETLINQGKLVGENLRKEMLRDEATWRPILGNQYFERITRTGYTSGELAQALDNVLNGRQSQLPSQAALENAINQIYASSGMQSWASPEQRARALNFIGQGMSAAYGEPKVETVQNHDHMTPYQSASLRLQQRAQDLAEQKEAAKQAGVDGSQYITPTQPVDSKAELAKQWHKDVENIFNRLKGRPATVKTSSGKSLVVHDWREATSLVYNGKARNEGFELLGLDVAADPLGWAQSTKSHLYGKANLRGQEVTIRTGAGKKNGMLSGITNDVAIYVETSPGHWGYHEGLTETYKKLRSQVENSVDYYKKNYPEVYKAALNPEEEKKLRERYDVADNVPTIGLYDAISASPMTSTTRTNEIIVAQSGDNGKAVREQLAAQLSTNYDALEKQLKSKEIQRSPSYGIQKMKDGRLPEKGNTVKLSDVFERKDGQITNINEIRVTPESIKKDKFIVYTTKGAFAVPVDMFGSASIIYMQRMKQLGQAVNICLDNAAYLANSDVDSPDLVAVSEALSQLTQQVVNPADVKDLLSTKQGREDLYKYYQNAIMTSVPLLLGATVRFARFPAASLTSSKDTQ